MRPYWVIPDFSNWQLQSNMCSTPASHRHDDGFHHSHRDQL